MGSRKKKIPLQKNKFLQSYKELNLNERIAYKAWAYWYGRRRFSLIDLIMENRPVQQWRHYVMYY